MARASTWAEALAQDVASLLAPFPLPTSTVTQIGKEIYTAVSTPSPPNRSVKRVSRNIEDVSAHFKGFERLNEMDRMNRFSAMVAVISSTPKPMLPNIAAALDYLHTRGRYALVGEFAELMAEDGVDVAEQLNEDIDYRELRVWRIAFRRECWRSARQAGDAARAQRAAESIAHQVS